jgi:ABC-type branched-subunit amino acid transport system substrate-binding protein
MFLRTFALAALAVLGAAQALSAETGVTDQTIVLGHSIALSGALGDLGKEYQAGARLYFDHLNGQGGIVGRKIRLISLDDAYDTGKALENTKKLVEQDKVFAVFGQFGTGITLASLPLTTGNGIPLFAPYTGADALRDSGNRFLFHIRASYGEETEKIIEQLVGTGVKDIAVVYQNDGFGKAGLQGAEQALARRSLKPVAVGPIEMPAVDIKKAMEVIGKAKPGAIVMVTAGKPSVAFIREYMKTGQPTQYYALSVVSSRQLVQELGPSAHGIAISQVLPSPWRTSTPVVREYQQVLTKANSKEFSYTSLEGFIAAKVFAEALKRAGKDLTREKLVTTLEGMRNYDAGGFVVDFGPNKHNGSSYVDLSIISKDGQFLR